MINKDLVIIGGGSAGISAAISAYDNGVKDILIIEKDAELGGILNQCIHNGFGLELFKEELSGPEFALKLIDEMKERNIDFRLNSYVYQISKEKVVTYTNEYEGVVEIKCKAIIFATGCFEKSAGTIALGGKRLSGIMSAGVAQKHINIDGYMIGKKVVILGSGDIGLIMARRLTLEGAKVELVAEIMPYSNGLNRNIAQCLNDYDIPLYLSTTVKEVRGTHRVESVVLVNVDENLNYIKGSEREVECDTLILSVGLLPYAALLKPLNISFSLAKGPRVNSLLETDVSGIFACGNCLHVHDLVDFVSIEGKQAGKNAAKYILNSFEKDKEIEVKNLDNVSYVIPNKIITPINYDFDLKFRVKKPMNNVELIIKDNNDNVIYKKRYMYVLPSEMEKITLNDEIIKTINDNKITCLSCLIKEKYE